MTAWLDLGGVVLGWVLGYGVIWLIIRVLYAILAGPIHRVERTLPGILQTRLDNFDPTHHHRGVLNGTYWDTEQATLIWSSGDWTYWGIAWATYYLWISEATKQVFLVEVEQVGNGEIKKSIQVFPRSSDLVEFMTNRFGLGSLAVLHGEIVWFPDESEQPERLDLSQIKDIDEPQVQARLVESLS